MSFRIPSEQNMPLVPGAKEACNELLKFRQEYNQARQQYKQIAGHAPPSLRSLERLARKHYNSVLIPLNSRAIDEKSVYGHSVLPLLLDCIVRRTPLVNTDEFLKANRLDFIASQDGDGKSDSAHRIYSAIRTIGSYACCNAFSLNHLGSIAEFYQHFRGPALIDEDKAVSLGGLLASNYI
ncbi:MAG: hypothetical protein AABX10_04870 [Nanoarchaeota archaeon]